MKYIKLNNIKCFPISSDIELGRKPGTTPEAGIKSGLSSDFRAISEQNLTKLIMASTGAKNGIVSYNESKDGEGNVLHYKIEFCLYGHYFYVDLTPDMINELIPNPDEISVNGRIYATCLLGKSPATEDKSLLENEDPWIGYTHMLVDTIYTDQESTITEFTGLQLMYSEGPLWQEDIDSLLIADSQWDYDGDGQSSKQKIIVPTGYYDTETDAYGNTVYKYFVTPCSLQILKRYDNKWVSTWEDYAYDVQRFNDVIFDGGTSYDT